MNRKKRFIPATIGVAAVWFGTHAGGGFATGRQEVNFFVQFGWHAVWIGFLSMVLMGTAIYFGLELARINRTHDYRSWVTKLFEPYAKIPSLLWELLFLYAAILAAGAAIAGTADLLFQSLHIPYVMAVILTGSLLLLLTTFGSGLVRNASTAMSVFIILALSIVVVLGIIKGSGNIGQVIGQKVNTAPFPKILWMAVIYGAFPSVLIASLVSVSEPLNSRLKCLKVSLYGVLINGFMLVSVCLMLLGFFPDVVKENLPVYYVTGQLGHSWLFALYSLVLFFALVSTGVGMTYGVVKRFEKALSTGNGIFKRLSVRRITISAACLLISAGISLFGLSKIVAVGYFSLGLLSIGLNIIPLLVIAPFKIKKARQKQP